jgi:hypothetical protein
MHHVGFTLLIYSYYDARSTKYYLPMKVTNTLKSTKLIHNCVQMPDTFTHLAKIFQLQDVFQNRRSITVETSRSFQDVSSCAVISNDSFQSVSPFRAKHVGTTRNKTEYSSPCWIIFPTCWSTWQQFVTNTVETLSTTKTERIKFNSTTLYIQTGSLRIHLMYSRISTSKLSLTYHASALCRKSV